MALSTRQAGSRVASAATHVWTKSGDEAQASFLGIAKMGTLVGASEGFEVRNKSDSAKAPISSNCVEKFTLADCAQKDTEAATLGLDYPAALLGHAIGVVVPTACIERLRIWV